MMIEVEPAAEPAALVLFRMRHRAIAKHVGIQTAPGSFLHAYERLGVIEQPLTQSWRRRIRKTDGGATQAENLNALPGATDMVVALDRLQVMAPAVESVSLVLAWFGDDLRAGSCRVRPGVEVSAKSTTPVSWSDNGIGRANAFLVSRDDQDRPVYGGTPSDFVVVRRMLC